MSFFAPVGASYYSPIQAAGLILARVVPGFTNPAVLRTNNKAGHPRALRALDSQTAARFARRCRQRYESMRLAILFLASMLFSEALFACAAGVDPEQIAAENAREILETADVVFRGTVVSSVQTDDGFQRLLFKIETTFKGPAVQQLYVVNISLLLSCGGSMVSGGEYFVFGKFTEVSNEVFSRAFVSAGKAKEYEMDLGFDS